MYQVLNSNHNISQINIFKELLMKFQKNNIRCHLLNSGGLFNYFESHYDYVRTGLSIYGISPLGEVHTDLKPVMEFKAPIVHIKNIFNGEKVGYGCSFIAKENMRIAIVQCGYADGLVKDFENDGYVYHHSKQFPIIGKIYENRLIISQLNVTTN